MKTTTSPFVVIIVAVLVVVAWKLAGSVKVLAWENGLLQGRINRVDSKCQQLEREVAAVKQRLPSLENKNKT